MRYLGLDLGSKTLGIAISDLTQTLATILTTLNFKDEDYDKGIFQNPEVFNVDEEDVDEFDKNFEYKEKRVQEGQLEIN